MSWSAPRSSSRAWTSRTPTRSSSTGPTRSAWPSSTSSAAASAGPAAAPTPTCSTGAASGSPTRRASGCRPSSTPRSWGRLPDRPVGPRDPRRRQHPRRGAARPRRRRRLRPVHAPAGRGRRGAEGRVRRPAAGRRASGRGRGPAGGRAPAGLVRARDRPEAGAVPAPRPRPIGRRAGRLPPGAGRPVRAAAAAGPAAARGRGAAHGGRERRHRLDLARGGRAGRPAGHAVSGSGRCEPSLRWAATSFVLAATRPASACRATPPDRGAWPNPWWRVCCPQPRSSRSSASARRQRRPPPSAAWFGQTPPSSRNLWAARVARGRELDPGGVRHGQPVGSVAPRVTATTRPPGPRPGRTWDAANEQGDIRRGTP